VLSTVSSRNIGKLKILKVLIKIEKCLRLYTRPRLATIELPTIMSSLCRKPTEDFDRQVSAVAMNDRFILIGKTDGFS
jgi:hypothetical protein